MKREAVIHLVHRELLEQRDGVIAADAVERFREKYVTGAELARKSETSPRALAEKLALRGVLPVVGPGLDGGRQNVYLRADLADISIT